LIGAARPLGSQQALSWLARRVGAAARAGTAHEAGDRIESARRSPRGAGAVDPAEIFARSKRNRKKEKVGCA